MKKNRLRAVLERHGRTVITGEVSILISLITFTVAGTPLALIVGIIGIILTAIVGIVVTERENRARERERRAHEAEIAPVRASALKQVSSAAFELVRYAMLYRDAAGGQPRQARISIVDLARGATPEAGWAVTEVDRLWDELRARARAFAADSGPAVAELDLPLRRHVHAIDELLSQALDDMSGVAHGATTIFNGRQVGHDDEVARGRAQLEDATRALRARLQEVVTRAQALMDAAASLKAPA
jgi:hypothetical protein